jgi:two-component system response regulator ResD
MTKRRILLADDEDSVRQVYGMLLSDEFDVVEARNGKEALELYSKAQGTFDLVITDYEMPLLKGNVLARRIRELCPTQPIIMITAFEPPRLNRAVDNVVHKPFSLTQLREAIAKAIGPRS